MRDHSFEIKVALLGNVSAGKTTVLNALLGDKYGEVAMKRTTACINYFTTISKNPLAIPTINETPRSAESILKEITLDNQTKINKDGTIVLEKFFQVELEKPIVEGRADTNLVLIDIPGINEAGTENKYQACVKKKWNTFDCVVVVMDGRQGVNTEDQVFLLKLVKECNNTIKRIPVIVLCNKVDDPLDQEVTELVNETKMEVSKILGAGSHTFIPISAIQAYVYLCASNMSLQQFKNFDRALLDKLGKEHLGRHKWSSLSDDEKIQEAWKIVTDMKTYEQSLNESGFDVFLSTLNRVVGGEVDQTCLIHDQINTSTKELAKPPFDPNKIMEHFKRAFSTMKYLEDQPIKGCIVGQYSSFFNNVIETFCAYNCSVLDKFKSSFPNSIDINQLTGPIDVLHQYCTFLSQNIIGYKTALNPKEVVDVAKQMAVEEAKHFIQQIILFLYKKYSRRPCAAVAYQGSDSETKKAFNSKFVNFDSKFLNHVEWSIIWDSFLLMYYDKNVCTDFCREKYVIEKVATECRSFQERPCPFCWKSALGIYQTGGSRGTCLKCTGNKECRDIIFVWKDVDDGHNKYIRLSPFFLQYKWVLSSDGNTVDPVCCDSFQDDDLKNNKVSISRIKVSESVTSPNHFGYLLLKYSELKDTVTTTTTTTNWVKSVLEHCRPNKKSKM